MGLTARDFIHTEDARALAELEAIPGLARGVTHLLRLAHEPYFRAFNMASKVRVGPRQLPRLHGHLVHACDRLEIEVPELYVELDRNPNAYTIGDERPFVCVTTGLLEVMSDDETAAVIAHECGHVACRHVRYHTAAHLAATLLDGVPGVDTAMRVALLYWSRRSELSADRAAALVAGDGGVVVRTMMKLAGGGHAPPEDLQLAEFVRQADEVDDSWERADGRFFLALASLRQSHPFPAIRAREIVRWVGSEEFGVLVDRLAQPGMRCACGAEMRTADAYCAACGNPVEA